MLTLKTYIYRGVAVFIIACVLVVLVYIFIQYILQVKPTVDDVSDNKTVDSGMVNP